MMLRRAATLAFLLTGAAVAPKGVAAAQAFVPQPQEYLLTTDVSDARSLWVNPAGLGRRREASISALLTAERAGGLTSLSQYGVTLASGVLAFGWQHDRLRAGGKSDVFVVGLAGGTPAVALGADRRWYRGSGTKDGSWDLGVRYRALPSLETSLVWRDIGSPIVFSDTIFSTLVPGFALALLRGRLLVGADWELVTRGWSSSAIRLGGTVSLPMSLALNVRGELDGDFDGRSLAFGLTWNGLRARATAFQTSHRAPAADRVGIWGAAVSTPLQRRRFGR